MIKDQEAEKASKPRVSMHFEKREPFYRLGFNENHLPHQQNYDKVRAKKPKLEQWDNPPFNWPPRIPSPTMHKGRTLLNMVDREEKLRIES